MDNSIKSLKIGFIIAIGIVTVALTWAYIDIENSNKCLNEYQGKNSFFTCLYTKPGNCMDKDKWQGLIINIEGFFVAILLGFYTVIRMDRTERWRKEDKLTELYAEALRNLYTTEKEELQLLGIRELYNTYQELNQKVSPEFEGQLQRKILDSIFEYLREIGVREVGDDKQSKDKAANKIFDLFLKGNLSFPKGYLIHLEDADLEDADLQNANLQGAHLQGANLQGAYLEDAKLQNAKLLIADLQGATLIGADLRGAMLQEANLESAGLQNADLRGAHLESAKLQNADLRDADLQGAGLGFAKLQGADLEDAKLQKANLFRAELQGAKLQSAKLQGAILQGAHLQGAKLQGAHLQGAILYGADLQGAKLQGAHLEGADLQGARLEFANLHGAHLERADLQGVNLEGAIIYEHNSSMDIDSRIHERNKRELEEYGWKIVMLIKEEIIDDKLVEVKQDVLTRMDR